MACSAFAGSIRGTITDADDKSPLYGVIVHLEDLQLHAITKETGEFCFPDVPSGTHALHFDLIGYRDTTVTVRVEDYSEITLKLQLPPNPLNLSGLIITGQLDRLHADVTGSRTLSQESIERSAPTTLSDAVSSQAGVSVRSMGPAPSRPVMRGFSGDRLLLLEDGERTGDLSATSADHALAIDPLGASYVELIRGPGSLLYGSYTLGGVLNAVKNRIPSERISRLTGSALLQAKSVSESGVGHAELSAPLGDFVAGAIATRNRSSDVDTPEGKLRNTFLRSDELGTGVAHIDNRGYAGAAASYYESEYGLPGGFVGAHPKGVRIALERRHVEAAAERKLDRGPLSSMLLRGSYSRYYHGEYESNGSLGIEFGVLTYNFSLINRLRKLGRFENGAFMLWSEKRDFASGGFSFSPGAGEDSYAAALLEDTRIGPWRWQMAVRGDYRRVSPEEERVSTRIGLIHGRDFGGVSAGLNLSRPISTQWSGSLGLMKSYRSPTLEELYSEGPHLAAYSFEIGNPELSAESGLGLDLTARWRPVHGYLDLSFYYNRISDFVFALNSGRINFRTLLPEYQYQGADAAITGVELSSGRHFGHGYSTELMASATWGDLTSGGTPLPSMPPASALLSARYECHNLTIMFNSRGALSQLRVAEFEFPTAAYLVFDASAHYELKSRSILQTIRGGVTNLLNSDYRNHLSRVKSILPEAGRGVYIQYSIHFS